MATVFQWSGKTRTGAVEGGEIAAGSKDEVVAQLRKRNIIATSVTKKKKQMAISLPFGGKIKDRDVVIFTRQFSTMIDAGLPLVQALDILASQASNKQFTSIINQIKGDVEGGSTYADALRKHPKAFT